MYKPYNVIQKLILRNSSDWKFWIICALVFKTLIFVFQISMDRPNDVPGFIGSTSPDTESYLLPVENLVYHGSYTPDYRMPGYAVVYLPLLIFFSKAWACNFVLIIQLLLSALSVYCLALTAKIGFQSNRIFYLVFYLFAISSYTSIFDIYLLSESFCTSITIFAVFFLAQYFTKRKPLYLACSGLFLTWVIFLRPMYAPLLLLFLLILIFHEVKTINNTRAIAKATLLFLIPYILIESAWVLRNYVVHKRVVVLTTSLYSLEFERSYILELMNFVKTWGGDRTWWNPGSEMQWFGLTGFDTTEKDFQPIESISIPPEIYTTRFNKDSLELIRTYIYKINHSQRSVEEEAYYTRLVKNKLDAYTQSIKEEKKFLYYFKAPVKLFVRFFFHSGTYNLYDRSFENLNVIEKSIKIFYSLLYVCVVLTGLTGMIAAMINHNKNPVIMLIALTLLYSVVLFPIILRQIEYRYFVPAYPFLLVMACHGFSKAIEFAKKR